MIRIAYLVGQYPAINHGYLVAEVQQLRKLGIQVEVASINPPDRPPEELHPAEGQEARRTFYIKRVSPLRALGPHLAEAFSHPWRYLRGMVHALRLAGLSARRLLYHTAYFAEAVLVGRWMRRKGISHVHANFGATVALITARTFPVTMSFAIHGHGELHNPAGALLAERIAGSKFVRSVSRYGRGQAMLSCGREHWEKLEYVPLGIDAAEFPPQPFRENPSPLRLLCLGRLAPEKGQTLLLEAVAAIEGIYLHLAGDGPDRAQLERNAAQLGIASRVVFEGWVGPERRLALYGQTDVFVLSSLSEGIPIVLMEAMAMEIPCVAPHIMGIPELIDHGENGWLFSPADAGALTEALRRLAGSSELRQKLGVNGRQRVLQDYDMARNCERWGAVLKARLVTG